MKLTGASATHDRRGMPSDLKHAFTTTSNVVSISAFFAHTPEFSPTETHIQTKVSTRPTLRSTPMRSALAPVAPFKRCKCSVSESRHSRPNILKSYAVYPVCPVCPVSARKNAPPFNIIFFPTFFHSLILFFKKYRGNLCSTRDVSCETGQTGQNRNSKIKNIIKIDSYLTFYLAPYAIFQTGQDGANGANRSTGKNLDSGLKTIWGSR